MSGVGCGKRRPEGPEYGLQLLPVRAVARNRSFRFENSFMRFKPSFSDTVTRGGRWTLISLLALSFFMKLFSYTSKICQLRQQTIELTLLLN
jgi:hypothetical protein